jgi:hypothetical protein
VTTFEGGHGLHEEARVRTILASPPVRAEPRSVSYAFLSLAFGLTADETRVIRFRRARPPRDR